MQASKLLSTTRDAMPLIKSSSKKAISENIRREVHAGKKHDQAIAIAMSIARRARKADGGDVDMEEPAVAGPLAMPEQVNAGFDFAGTAAKLAGILKKAPPVNIPITESTTNMQKAWAGLSNEEITSALKQAMAGSKNSQAYKPNFGYPEEKIYQAAHEADLKSKAIYEKYRDSFQQKADRIVPPEELREWKRIRSGYDTPAFRGTRKKGEAEIDVRRSPEEDYYMAQDQRLANMYANHLNDMSDETIREGARIQPLWINTKNYLEWDAGGKSWTAVNDKAIAKAREEGKPGVIMRNVYDEPGSTVTGPSQTVYISLDNKTVKSKFAKWFDPKKNDLLWTQGVGIVGPGMAIMSQPGEGAVPKKSGGAIARVARRYADGGALGFLSEKMPLSANEENISNIDDRRGAPLSDPIDALKKMDNPSFNVFHKDSSHTKLLTAIAKLPLRARQELFRQIALDLQEINSSPFKNRHENPDDEGLRAYAEGGDVEPDTFDARFGELPPSSPETITPYDRGRRPVPLGGIKNPSQPDAREDWTNRFFNGPPTPGDRTAMETIGGMMATPSKLAPALATMAGSQLAPYLMPSSAQAQESDDEPSRNEKESAEYKRINDLIAAERLKLAGKERAYRNNPERMGRESAPINNQISRLETDLKKADEAYQRRLTTWEQRQGAAKEAQKQSEQARKDKLAESELPFRARYPELAKNVPVYGAGASSGLALLAGLLSKGKSSAVLKSMGIGGIEGAFTANVPNLVDVAMLPESSQAYKDAKNTLLSKENLLYKTPAEAALHAGAAGSVGLPASYIPKFGKALFGKSTPAAAAAIPPKFTPRTVTLDDGSKARQLSNGRWMREDNGKWKFSPRPDGYAEGGDVVPEAAPASFDQRFGAMQPPQQAPAPPAQPFAMPQGGPQFAPMQQAAAPEPPPMSDIDRMKMEVQQLHGVVEKEAAEFQRKKQIAPGNENAVWPHRSAIERAQGRIEILENKINEAERHQPQAPPSEWQGAPQDTPAPWQGPPQGPSQGGGPSAMDALGGLGGAGGVGALLWALNRGRGRPPTLPVQPRVGGRFASPDPNYVPRPKYRSGPRLPGKEQFAAGGDVPWYTRQQARSVMRDGLIGGNTPGRSDRLPMNVAAGSYVIPADVVSGMGQGNSKAGADILGRMFKAGPLGMSMGKVRSSRPRGFADGGGADDDVPIAISDGEYLISPESVAELGGGDMDRGHTIIDKFVKNVRSHTIKELKRLPGPKKS